MIIKENKKIAKFFEVVVYIAIIVSIIPLFFPGYIIDYRLRLLVFFILLIQFFYNLYYKKFKYKFIMVVDFISTISLLMPVHALILVRLFGLIKFTNKSKSTRRMIKIFKENKELLYIVMNFIIIYQFIVSLLILNIEPNTYKNYWNAFFQMGIALTTLGYGNVVPQTVLGQAIVLVTAIVGIVLLSIPGGVVIGSFISANKK